MVPVYNTIVKASAGVGNGYADDSYRPDVIDEICIMDKSLLGLYGSNLHAIQVDGDSMEPIIENGDYVVYTETQDWTTGCLMVVRLDTRLYVKGMRLKGNTLVLRSANPDYSDIIVGDDTTFEIIGRVVKIVPPQRDPKAVY